MSVISGKDGTLLLGATEVTPVTNWRLEKTSANKPYAANDTGGAKKRVPSVKDSAGSFEIKATDTGHVPVEEGDAATLNLHIDGQTYRLGPLTLRDYGEIENRILSRRPDPVAVAVRSLAGLEPKQQEFLLGRAYDRAVAAPAPTGDELDAWRRTPEGFCCLFWLMIRKHHPEITFQQATELVEQLAGGARDQLGRRMEQCTGLPPGNPSSQAQPTAARCRGKGGHAN